MLGPGNMPVSRRDFTEMQLPSIPSLVVVKTVIFLKTEARQGREPLC